MSFFERLASVVTDNGSKIQSSLITLLMLGGAYVALVSYNNTVNANVKRTCPSGLYVIGQISTALGNSYVCLSRVQHLGPSTPIKD
jgi:hypothetical protein